MGNLSRMMVYKDNRYLAWEQDAPTEKLSLLPISPTPLLPPLHKLGRVVRHLSSAGWQK